MRQTKTSTIYFPLRDRSSFASVAILLFVVICVIGSTCNIELPILPDEFLPDPPRRTYNTISDDGNVIAGFETLPSNDNGKLQNSLSFAPPPTQAMRQFVNQNAQLLGKLERPEINQLPYADDSAANALSADGYIVVGQAANDISREAFRWTIETGMQTLEPKPENMFGSTATDVSANGRVIIGSMDFSPPAELLPNRTQAFRWTAENGYEFFIVPSDKEPNRTYARAVSNDGNVIAGYVRTQSGHKAFRWTNDNGGALIHDLTDTETQSFGTVISGDGNAIFGTLTRKSDVEPFDTMELPFRWTEQDGIIELGVFATGRQQGRIYGASFDGSVIVGTAFVDAATDLIAVVWDADLRIYDVRDVLVTDDAERLKNWKLISVHGVSADGRRIVGNGITPNGTSTGWTATIMMP